MKTLAALLILTAGVAGAQTSLDETLMRIAHNVDGFENLLPDFVCHERIVSRTVAEKDGSVEKETTIDSAFSGRQKRSSLGKLAGKSFTEERSIETVNGGSWRDKAMPKGIFLVGGAYSSTLVSIFGSKGQVNYSFSLAAPDSKAIVIDFSTGNSRLRLKSGKTTRNFQETGRAWFDPATFEIVRLERRITAQGAQPGNDLPITVEYAPVRIGDDTFQMPRRVTATAHRVSAGKAERGEYEAKYTDYRRFGASGSIQYPDIQK